jgi:hypothetical protein
LVPIQFTPITLSAIDDALRLGKSERCGEGDLEWRFLIKEEERLTIKEKFQNRVRLYCQLQSDEDFFLRSCVTATFVIWTFEQN